MNQFLKYLGAFCLLTIAASLAFCSVGIYNAGTTINSLLAGADNYTCRQFNYDLTNPQADKLPAIAIATVLYGSGEEDAPETIEKNQQELVTNGASIAVAKATALCHGKPDERLLNLFAQSLVSPTAAGVSSSINPAAVSPTLNTKH